MTLGKAFAVVGTSVAVSIPLAWPVNLQSHRGIEKAGVGVPCTRTLFSQFLMTGHIKEPKIDKKV